MLLALLFTATTALAQPGQIVAIGDGLVAAAPEEIPVAPLVEADTVPGPAPVAGGWISALADCLDEGAPAQWSVADHSVPGETARSALDRVEDVRSLTPKVVLVGVGAQELAVKEAKVGAFEDEVTALIVELQQEGTTAPQIILVGTVPPSVAQMTDESTRRKPDQKKVDTRTEAFNGVLARVALAADSVHHVDLWGEWPREGDDRQKLTVDGWRLSHQGHARVAAAVCDKVLSWARAKE